VATYAQTPATEGVDVLTATLANGSPLLRRRVNQTMRDGRRGSEKHERIPFFCECVRTRCDEPMWLTVDVYDRRASRGEPLLLPGHH
jgi:hypothetical protein